jgi:hypothetical protein
VGIEVATGTATAATTMVDVSGRQRKSSGKNASVNDLTTIGL